MAGISSVTGESLGILVLVGQNEVCQKWQNLYSTIQYNMMASCEQIFCLCVINIGILLHNKLFKGNGIMKHVMFGCIYLFIK